MGGYFMTVGFPTTSRLSAVLFYSHKGSALSTNIYNSLHTWTIHTYPFLCSFSFLHTISFVIHDELPYYYYYHV